MLFTLLTCVFSSQNHCQTSSFYPPAPWCPEPPKICPPRPICPQRPVCPPVCPLPPVCPQPIFPPVCPPVCPLPKPVCPQIPICPLPQPIYPPVCPQPIYPPICPQPIFPTPNYQQQIFVQKVIQFLERKYWFNIDPATKQYLLPQVIRVLNLIYTEFSDSNDRILFVSFAIFTTSGFKVLDSDPQCGCKWRPRGILQICTEPNYKLLAELTRDSVWYYSPERLACLDDQATMASIMFFKYLVYNSGCPRTFLSVLEVLRTTETDPRYICWSYPSLQHRFEDYNELCRLLMSNNFC